MDHARYTKLNNLMMLNRTRKILLPLGLLFSFIGLAQEFNNFDVRYQDNIKGDLTFIANNIVNISSLSRSIRLSRLMLGTSKLNNPLKTSQIKKIIF